MESTESMRSMKSTGLQGQRVYGCTGSTSLWVHGVYEVNGLYEVYGSIGSTSLWVYGVEGVYGSMKSTRSTGSTSLWVYGVYESYEVYGAGVGNEIFQV